MKDFDAIIAVFPVIGYSLAIIAGLIFGSFLTFLFYRIKHHEPWLWGEGAARSKCPSCGTVLRARDLIPVVSWVLSRGRCRYCGQGISIRYPLIEIACAIIFLIIWLTNQG